jgi:hypothetical protein
MAAARKYFLDNLIHPIRAFTTHPFGSSYPGPEALYDYELFAVINH